MAPFRLPRTCSVLVVEKEPLQALALEYVLEDIGCRAVGPVWLADDVLRSVRREAPNLALVDSNLQGHLLPAVACLNHFRVPFAFLVMGGESEALDRVRDLRALPRVDRPFHAPTVHRAALKLYRQDLKEKITRADQRIAEGRRRLADQLRRMERSGAEAGDAGPAQILAREIARGLRAMRAGRVLLAEQLELLDEVHRGERAGPRHMRD